MLRRDGTDEGSEGQHADEELGLVVGAVSDADAEVSVVQAFGLLLEVGKMEHDPLRGVAAVRHLEDEGLLPGRSSS